MNTFANTENNPAYPGEASDFYGYTRYDFNFEGRDCIIVEPKVVADNKPWIWRARFFGHEPQTDLCLLARGFHLVYMDVANMFGSPNAVKNWTKFYNLLVNEYNFKKKAALEGMSRGGLIVFNWARLNPEKVACIYVDAPVCDIRSWPGKSRTDLWNLCLDQYNIAPEDIENAKINPLDGLEPLAKNDIPIFIVCGDADEVVPMKENTTLLYKRYQELGGNVKLIIKPGVEHHPHSLEDPKEIVCFIMQHTVGLDNMYYLRDKLQNCHYKFTYEKKGTVAFLGGSITHNPGWREMICDYLKEEFSDTQFTFINAGIPSLGSVPNAFRLNRDVLSKGCIDLLFIESAVNDSVNHQNLDHVKNALSGIIKHSRKVNPCIDIAMMYFVDPEKMNQYNNGQCPPVIDVHDNIAKHFNISAINLALEVTERINTEQFTWEHDFIDLHPSLFGQKIYFNSIKRFLKLCWAKSLKENNKIIAHDINQTQNNNYKYSYSTGSLTEVTKNWSSDEFKITDNWTPTDNIKTREGFVDIPVLEATVAGAKLKYEFHGNTIGLFTICGPDVGKVKYCINGKPYPIINFHTEWSHDLHLPRALILADQLSNTQHELTLEVIEDKDPNSNGHACRIAYFLINDGQY